MKFIDRRPFADPDAAARKLVEIANDVEAALARSVITISAVKASDTTVTLPHFLVAMAR
jgi:hypothetical protein